MSSTLPDLDLAHWLSSLEGEPAEAAILDRDDPLRAFRDRFAIPKGTGGDPVTYLCGNSLGCMPIEVPEALTAECTAWGERGVTAHLEGALPWYTYHRLVRDGLALLAGAEADEVVAMNSLTVNLHLMLVSFYRPEGDRFRILMEHGAFPSDQYAVRSHVAARGINPDEAVATLEPRPGEATLRTEDIEARITSEGSRLALVLVGGVHYATGEVLDLRSVAAAAHQAGAAMGTDLAHAIGNVPLSLHDWDVDFAVWCSYKYLNAGPGAVAGCFVHRRHGCDVTRPRFAGWWGNDPETRFTMPDRFVPVTGADGWQLSNPPILSLAPLRVSLAVFEEAGFDRLRVKSVRLTAVLEHLIRKASLPGVSIVTPSEPEKRGCQLTLALPGTASAVFESLARADVVVDRRSPDLIRLSPVPLYNSYADVYRAADVLRRVVVA